MRLILVRHGQFVGNLVTEDTPDGPLTSVGRYEAVMVAEALKSEQLTHIVASPLMRGLETATEIANLSGMRFTVWKDLYEYRVKGRYVGPPVDELRRHYPKANFESDMEPDGWICGGVETPDDVVERARNIAGRIVREYGPDGTIAIVSHAGFISVVLGVLLGVQDPHSAKFRQANCCINVLRLVSDHVVVKALNKTDHIDKIAIQQFLRQERSAQ